jgi:hypothetical protein
MEITTMLNALIDSHGRIPGIFMEKRVRQHFRIRLWFVRRDKWQREEIAHLKAQVAEYSEALSYFTTMSARAAIEFFTKDGNGR